MTSKPAVKTKGSRKRATARIWLHRGKGELTVNDQPLAAYFPSQMDQKKIETPLLVTETKGKVYASIKVAGGGKSSQVEAIIHGLSRALDRLNSEKFHSSLKGAGFLTRDDRERERRKPGTARSARAKRQSPKR